MQRSYYFSLLLYFQVSQTRLYGVIPNLTLSPSMLIGPLLYSVCMLHRIFPYYSHFRRCPAPLLYVWSLCRACILLQSWSDKKLTVLKLSATTVIVILYRMFSITIVVLQAKSNIPGNTRCWFWRLKSFALSNCPQGYAR